MSTLNTVAELAPTTVRATGPRHDIYGLIHKGLRSFMLDTLARLGRADVAAPSFSSAIAQTRALLGTLHDHLRHENEFLHPALEARSPGGATTTALEHADHERAYVELTRLVSSVEHEFAQGTGSELEWLSKQLYLSLSNFVAENLAHMYREETETTKLLWRHYTDEELREIQGAIVASETAEELAVTLRWMLPSVTPKERLGLLGGARQGLPPPAFQGVMQLAREVLEPADYRQLAAAFG
ncbi:MAG TPA: hemerythrin domain-containing protein [Polyangiaceae bacterium]|nr:hemerythrin domain-containing protein [Polyangiaceae bacterium]